MLVVPLVTDYAVSPVSCSLKQESGERELQVKQQDFTDPWKKVRHGGGSFRAD